MFKKELNINSKESTEVMVSDHTSDTQRNIAMKAGGNNKKKPKKPQQKPPGLVPKAKNKFKRISEFSCFITFRFPKTEGQHCLLAFHPRTGNFPPAFGLAMTPLTIEGGSQ